MRIVNKRGHVPTEHDVYVGRPSVLGNPYSHTTGTRADQVVATRDEAVERYGRWLLGRIRDSDPLVIAALNALDDDSVLVCWCAPQRCHAEMIVRAALWVQSGQKEKP